MMPAVRIAIKDLRLMARDRSALVFTVIFPLLFGIFFGAIYADSTEGQRAPIGVVVVNQDEGPSGLSTAVIQVLDSNPRLTLTHASTYEEATAEVIARRAAALIVLPDQFGEWLELTGRSSQGQPLLRYDSGRRAESGILQGVVTAALYSVFMESMSSPEAADRRRTMLLDLANQPDTDRDVALRMRAVAASLQGLAALPAVEGSSFNISLDSGDLVLSRDGMEPPNSFSITFPQAIIWAILGSAATFAVGLVAERNAGTLVRLRSMPIGAPSILAGKGIACMTVSLTVSLIFVILARMFLGVRPVSYPSLAIALLGVSFAFAGLMMLLATLGRSKTSPGQLSWGIILVMAITGGGMLPLFFMPSWLVSISHLSPVKWGILAIEAGVWRGASVLNLLLPLCILVGVGAAGFMIGSRAFLVTERA